MTSRERLVETLHFREPDRIPYLEWGIFGETLERWWTEGMPRDTFFNEWFDLDDQRGAPLNFSMCPFFKEEVLRVEGDTEIVRNLFGHLQRRWRGGRIGMPQWLDYPIHNEQEWNAFLWRYNPKTLERYPQDLPEWAASVQDRSWIAKLQEYRHVGLFGPTRNWIGLERLLYAFFDEPQWVHRMFNFIADYVCGILDIVGPHFQYDIVWFFEDVGFKTSTLVSPALFREFMMEPYKRMTERFKRYGMDILMIDSDGRNDELLPLWIEAGFTGFGPMECQAEGMGPVEIRKRFGKELCLVGGMNKRALAGSKKDVEAEVMGKLPWMLEHGGGYIPTMDHMIPPDASYPNYLYYWQLVREVAEGKHGGARFGTLLAEIDAKETAQASERIREG